MELLQNPIEQLRIWYAEAEGALPNADVVAVATSNKANEPSVRMVNFKGWMGDALTFYSNYESRKGVALRENSRASMLFYWSALKRQVQVEGECVPMNSALSDSYFASRDREVQLSTLMSQQSRVLSSFEEMEREVESLRHRYDGMLIPRPAYWGGYVLTPSRIEFRLGREHRRHWRWEYSRSASGWIHRKLFP